MQVQLFSTSLDNFLFEESVLLLSTLNMHAGRSQLISVTFAHDIVFKDRETSQNFKRVKGVGKGKPPAA